MKYAVTFLVALFFIVSMPLVCSAGDINSNIGFPPPHGEYPGSAIDEPPPFDFAGPPDVVVVPSGTSYVYMVPDSEGLYFYNGYWYRFYNGYWFRSNIYNGSWTYIETSFVPMVIVNVPLEYIYHLPSGYYRIHYQDFHRSWRTWDRNRYWNRHAWFKNELREDVRRDRFNRIRTERERVRRDEGIRQQPQDGRRTIIPEDRREERGATKERGRTQDRGKPQDRGGRQQQPQLGQKPQPITIPTSTVNPYKRDGGKGKKQQPQQEGRDSGGEGKRQQPQQGIQKPQQSSRDGLEGRKTFIPAGGKGGSE